MVAVDTRRHRPLSEFDPNETCGLLRPTASPRVRCTRPSGRPGHTTAPVSSPAGTSRDERGESGTERCAALKTHAGVHSETTFLAQSQPRSGRGSATRDVVAFALDPDVDGSRGAPSSNSRGPRRLARLGPWLFMRLCGLRVPWTRHRELPHARSRPARPHRNDDSTHIAAGPAGATFGTRLLADSRELAVDVKMRQPRCAPSPGGDVSGMPPATGSEGEARHRGSIAAPRLGLGSRVDAGRGVDGRPLTSDRTRPLANLPMPEVNASE
jgi:hypothetical protein